LFFEFSSKSFDLSEKKATSAPEIRAEKTNKIIIEIIDQMTAQSISLNFSNKNLKESVSKFYILDLEW
jgi:hypothetical protein